MTVSREQALSEDEFHHGTCTRTHKSRGGEQTSVEVCRRSGPTQTWKTPPDAFSTPITWGRSHGYIQRDNADQFHLAKECPLEVVEYRELRDDGRIIEVNKWGGGTLGRRYDGKWYVVVRDRKGNVALDDVLDTGTPKTHAEAAALAVESADKS